MKPLRALLILPLLLAASAPARASQDGWEYLTTTDDNITVYRKNVEGSDMVAFKGVTYANISIGKLVAVFRDSDQRKFWVDRYVEHVTLDKGPDMETYWIHFGLPWPVSDRDYVLKAVGQLDPTSHRYTVQISSVTDPRKGDNDCCVRAEVKKTFYEFTAIPGEKKTKLVVEVHTDPKGSLPTWLVNAIQKSWPSKTLRGLIAHATQSATAPAAEMAEWHTSVVAAEEPAAKAPDPKPEAQPQ